MSRSQTANTSAAVLWASAFVIAALTILQAGRLPGQSTYAETATNASDFSLVTARTGLGPDEKPYEVLYVVDNHSEVLLVYDIQNIQQGILIRDGGPLVNLFRGARR